ncbi:MAG: hypothetical protein LUG62_03970 [Clostridiales bacterium]|nr:hypothetical protein [Clostridiales bacterium]
MKEKDFSLSLFFKWGILLIAALALALALKAQPVSAASGNYMVVVSSGYLALRTAPAYDSSNEIGELYTGDTVTVSSYYNSTYWYVYSPKYSRYGYVNKNYLTAISSSSSSSSSSTWTVKVATGYLALRTAKAYDPSNEIGCLYTGDTVQVQNTSDSTYWYVYAPSLGKYGYVNRNYLYQSSSSSTTTVSGNVWTVKVQSGYLALRTAKAYDSSNEIGCLYTGDTVQVQNTSDATYWYVYAPSLGKYGYVNRNYLVGGSTTTTASYPTRTVRVATGYLALRTAKAYDFSNEIGCLYTGDTVQVVNTSDATYWYVYAPSLGKYGYVNCNYLY